MTDYGQHFSTIQTPQTQQADPRQVANSAGGFSFAVDKWMRLQRFLILGADGGSYYAGERELVIENAKAVQECLAEDGARTVRTIVEISDAGRAPKNDPAIFALAMAAGAKAPATRRAALDALPQVCRIGTHLFHFARDVARFRSGWPYSLRTAVARWYTRRSPQSLAYDVAKYQSRDKWSHRDLLRLSHAKPASPEQDAIFRWVVSEHAFTPERTVKRGKDGVDKTYAAQAELPAFLAAFNELAVTKDKATVIRLVREHHFTHEMLPTAWKNEPEVWEALLEHMPQTALIRNLGKMTSVGLLKPLSAAAKLAAERIADGERLKKARVHPIALLSALKVYQQGHGEKGSLTWQAVPQIVDALDEGFYLAFDAVEPTGKATMLALDVSGSMTMGTIAGIPGLTPRVASAAMAMVTARTEKNHILVAFTATADGQAGGKWGGGPPTLTTLTISPRQRLDDVCREMEKLPMGGTDCALPMLAATQEGWPVDAFQIFTDNETWAGSIHPFQALRQYRQKSGRNATLAVVGMTATEFSIADPSDPGMLDVVGFDAAAPAIMADFARGT